MLPIFTVGGIIIFSIKFFADFPHICRVQNVIHYERRFSCGGGANKNLR